MNQKETWEKLLHSKEKWIVFVLLGALVLLLSWPMKTKNNLSVSDKPDVDSDMLSINPIWSDVSEEGALRERQEYSHYLENQLEEALGRMRGVGETQVVIYMQAKEDEPYAITGVLVLAQGAGEEAVEVRIRNSLRTVLGISERQIAVQPLEKTVINSDAKDLRTGTKEKRP